MPNRGQGPVGRAAGTGVDRTTRAPPALGGVIGLSAFVPTHRVPPDADDGRGAGARQHGPVHPCRTRPPTVAASRAPPSSAAPERLRPRGSPPAPTPASTPPTVPHP
ncbi:hypothetical protein FRIGORI9N_70015 [Frigoribacterium sp. 9N]|nr:hypothetical protein FRIGORI9N_70015 [Frigoribacterium sp. 9N]